MKAGMDKFVGLILDGGHYFGMTVAHIINPDPAGEVNRFPSVDWPLAPFQ